MLLMLMFVVLIILSLVIWVVGVGVVLNLILVWMWMWVCVFMFSLRSFVCLVVEFNVWYIVIDWLEYLFIFLFVNVVFDCWKVVFWGNLGCVVMFFWFWVCLEMGCVIWLLWGLLVFFDVWSKFLIFCMVYCWV